MFGLCEGNIIQTYFKLKNDNIEVMNKKQLKRVTISAMAILILSIIPIFWIGQYLHPFSDDYVFGTEVHNVWNTTHSLSACMEAAWDVAVNMYHIWQGTYSACFLMALQPGAFGAYWVVPILLLSSLIASTFTLLYMIMRKVLHTSMLEYLFVSTIFVLINVQFVYSSYDAFYWYNGAMYYTLYYSLSLFLASLLIAYELSSTKRKYVIGGASIVLAIFIAGGNFVSGFGMAAILFVAIALLWWEQKRMPKFLVTIFAIYLISFAFSILAPGNAFREVAVKEYHPHIFAALGITINQSFTFIADRIISMMSLTFVALIPLVSKLARQSSFKFSHPWLCIVISLGLYCSFFFPHCYAMGYGGPNRVQNVYTYALFWLILVHMYYLSGAYIRKIEAKAPLSTAINQVVYAVKIKYSNTFRFSYLYAIIILLLAAIVKPSTTNRTLSLLVHGKIQASDQEMKERESILSSTANSVIELKPLTTKLPSDTHYDAMPDPGYWVNQAIAMYYNKTAVFTHPEENINYENIYLMKHYKKDVGPNNLKYKTFKNSTINSSFLTQRIKSFY